jgi:transcription initiation factor TFIIH subunit 3
MVFLNAFNTSSSGNRIIVISNLQPIYDSNEEEIAMILERLNHTASSLSKDFGYTLCLANTVKDSRILIFTTGEDKEVEYLDMLKNCFTAQRMEIRVDAVCLGGDHPTLNQTSVATKGSYISSENDLASNLFKLLGTIVEDQSPSFKVSCICHNRFILYGLVCPVCLSVYCKFTPICKKCKSKIAFIKQ